MPIAGLTAQNRLTAICGARQRSRTTTPSTMLSGATIGLGISTAPFTMTEAGENSGTATVLTQPCKIAVLEGEYEGDVVRDLEGDLDTVRLRVPDGDEVAEGVGESVDVEVSVDVTEGVNEPDSVADEDNEAAKEHNKVMMSLQCCV